MNETYKGTIKFYNSEKGYGFILREDGEEFFFHISAVRGLPFGAEPQKDAQVEFELTEQRNGKIAAEPVMMASEVEADATPATETPANVMPFPGADSDDEDEDDDMPMAA